MPEAAGDGQQVDDRIRRPADGGERDDRVVERRAGDDLRDRAALLDHLDREDARRVRRLQQPAVRAPGCRRSRRSSCRAPRRRVPWCWRCPWCCSARGCGSSTTPTSGRCPAARRPARTSSLSFQTSVPHPSACPRNVPLSIGPPGTTTAGRSTLAAAMSSAGIVLSQPPSSTRPSMGLARNISSIAIAAMLRQSMAVGRTSVSPRETTGRLSGMPPASYTPCLTLSRDLVEVGVAGGEIGCGVRDRDLRPAVERVVGEPSSHPGPMEVRVPVGAAVPLGAPSHGRPRPSDHGSIVSTRLLLEFRAAQPRLRVERCPEAAVGPR